MFLEGIVGGKMSLESSLKTEFSYETILIFASQMNINAVCVLAILTREKS